MKYKIWIYVIIILLIIYLGLIFFKKETVKEELVLKKESSVLDSWISKWEPIYKDSLTIPLIKESVNKDSLDSTDLVRKK